MPDLLAHRCDVIARYVVQYLKEVKRPGSESEWVLQVINPFARFQLSNVLRILLAVHVFIPSGFHSRINTAGACFLHMRLARSSTLPLPLLSPSPSSPPPLPLPLCLPSSYLSPSSCFLLSLHVSLVNVATGQFRARPPHHLHQTRWWRRKVIPCWC